MVKLQQLRADFRFKWCPNLLHEGGGSPPKFLHLDDFGKFLDSSGDLSIPSPTANKENRAKTMF